MAETFVSFIEGTGPGPRGEEDCCICTDPIDASTPTVTHQGLCQVTVCRQCFMSTSIHRATARPVQNNECCMCRTVVKTNYNAQALLERVGTDGNDDERFWPRLDSLTIDDLPGLHPDMIQRGQELDRRGISISGYEQCRHLERAVICPSVGLFLRHVYRRATDVAKGDSGRHVNGPFTYLRYLQNGVSVAFVRWLHAERQQLRPNFVRWCMTDRATRHYSTDDTSLSLLLWQGILDRNEFTFNFPDAALSFRQFFFNHTWYLVPEFSDADASTTELQFWALGAEAKRLGWLQQGERLSVTPPASDGSPQNWVVRLGAVGSMFAHEANYILRTDTEGSTDTLGNGLETWPGRKYLRQVIFGPNINDYDFANDLRDATAGMPWRPTGAVSALRQYLDEKAWRDGLGTNIQPTFSMACFPPVRRGEVQWQHAGSIVARVPSDKAADVPLDDLPPLETP